VTRGEATISEQRLRDGSSSLCKEHKVKQILQKITDVSMKQRNMIMFLCKLKSEDIALHAVNLDAHANLKRNQE
jgi:hypothetical protein